MRISYRLKLSTRYKRQLYLFPPFESTPSSTLVIGGVILSRIYISFVIHYTEYRVSVFLKEGYTNMQHRGPERYNFVRNDEDSNGGTLQDRDELL